MRGQGAEEGRGREKEAAAEMLRTRDVHATNEPVLRRVVDRSWRVISWKRIEHTPASGDQLLLRPASSASSSSSSGARAAFAWRRVYVRACPHGCVHCEHADLSLIESFCWRPLDTFWCFLCLDCGDDCWNWFELYKKYRVAFKFWAIVEDGSNFHYESYL